MTRHLTPHCSNCFFFRLLNFYVFSCCICFYKLLYFASGIHLILIAKFRTIFQALIISEIASIILFSILIALNEKFYTIFISILIFALCQCRWAFVFLTTKAIKYFHIAISLSFVLRSFPTTNCNPAGSYAELLLKIAQIFPGGPLYAMFE